MPPHKCGTKYISVRSVSVFVYDFYLSLYAGVCACLRGPTASQAPGSIALFSIEIRDCMLWTFLMLLNPGMVIE